jgi:hypothetical protein
MRATLPLRARSMLPWALDRLVPDAAARVAPPDLSIGRFASRPSRFGVPRPERREKAMEFRPCLAPCDRPVVFPEGSTVIRSRWLRHLPKETPRPHPNMGPEGLWDASGSTPRGGSTASVRAPEGAVPTSSRRISEETRSRPSARSEERRPVVRARAPHPSAVARVHDGETARRGRAHPEACTSACHSRAPRRMLRRTQSAESRRTPLGGRARRRHPEVVPLRTRGSGISSKLEAGSGQTVIVFTGTAAARSEDRVASPIPKNRRAGAEAPRVRLVPHIPPVVVIRREHRSARAEMDRDPSQAVPTEVESASVPRAPKRTRSPDR